jgi:methionyl-tRNA formyltransferase
MTNKIVMCGCLETGLDVMTCVLESGLNIDYFVLITKEKALEQKVSGYASFESLAQKYNIPIYYAEKYSLKSQNDINFFETHKFDLLIQGGWQRLFPTEILITLKVGAVGIHGSSEFLPSGRGRSPINWSLILDKTRFIMHYFLIKPGVDDGDVFYFEMFDINDWDDCRTLYYKNSILTTRVYLEWIPKLINGEFKVIPQIGEPSYFNKRSEDDGKIDFSSNIRTIYNLVRAVTKPYSGAFGFIDDKKVMIWKCAPFDTRISYYGHSIGEVVAVFSTGDFVINLKDGLLLITEYEYSGEIEKGKILT